MTTDTPTPDTPIAGSSAPQAEADRTDNTADNSTDNTIDVIDVRATDSDTSSLDDDEVRQKFLELIEAIERRAKAEATSVSDWRVQAVEKAKETLEQTEQFARDRQIELEESVKGLQDDAIERWTSLTKEAEDFTDRLQKAANEAWKIIMKQDEPSSSEAPEASESAESTTAPEDDHADAA